MVLYEELVRYTAGYMGQVVDTMGAYGGVSEVAAPLRVWLAERGVEFASYVIGA